MYTPVEIVDFILRAADDVSKKHFGRGLSDENVHILDPFTGTGTFMVRLLQSGLIDPKDLARKYANELHATEIILLAYYVAAANIETTFNALLAEAAKRSESAPPPPLRFLRGHRACRYVPDPRGRRHPRPHGIQKQQRAHRSAEGSPDQRHRGQSAVLIGSEKSEWQQREPEVPDAGCCLLYTSDAADDCCRV